MGLTVGALTGVAAAAPKVANGHDRASLATTWMVDQLQGSKKDHYTETFGKTAYADYGNTIDGILALDAAKQAQSAASRMTNWLSSNIDGYTEDTCTPGSTTYYPGSLAKALIAVEAQGDNGDSFGGLNLISTLQGTETTTGSDVGLYADDNAMADCAYESPVTQALALIALSDTGSTTIKPDAAAVRWLRSEVCPDGGYEDAVRRSISSSCPASDQDIDTTAFVVQGLMAVGSKTAADSSVRWILNHQGSSGGFQHNTNSTAIAVQAMLVTKHFKDAKLSEAYLDAHQLLCKSPVSRQGAVDYEGKYDTSGNQELEATTQSTQALARAPLATISKQGATSATPKTSCR